MDLREEILKSKRVAIVTHRDPDIDAIASSLSLAEAIRLNLDREVGCYVERALKNFGLNYMEKIQVRERIEADLVIALDCANFDRIVPEISYKRLINIDHHVTNTNFGSANIVDLSSSSTCELILAILRGLDFVINKGIAENIYAGIMSDTGGLSWGEVGKRTYESLAFLKDLGVDNNKMYQRLFANRSESSLRLLGYALQNFVYLEKFKLSYVVLREEDFKRVGATQEDREGIVDMLKSLGNADIAMVIRGDELTRVSLRSKLRDISKIALKFNGGGHRNAAAFVTPLSVDETIKKILDYLEE